MKSFIKRIKRNRYSSVYKYRPDNTSPSSTPRQSPNFAKALSSTNNSSAVGATMGNPNKFLLPKNLETEDQHYPSCCLHFPHNLPGIPFPNGKIQSEIKYPKYMCTCAHHNIRNNHYNPMTFISKELSDNCTESSCEASDLTPRDLMHTCYGFGQMKDNDCNNSDCDSLSITSYSDISEFEYSGKDIPNDESLNAGIDYMNPFQNGFMIPDDHDPTNCELEYIMSDTYQDIPQFKSKSSMMRHIFFPYPSQYNNERHFDLAENQLSGKRDLGKRGGLLKPIEKTMKDRTMLKPIMRSNTYFEQESCKRKNNTANTRQRQRIYFCDARRDKSVIKNPNSNKNIVFTSDAISIGDHIGISPDFKENLPNQVNYEYESKNVSLNGNRVFQCYTSSVDEVENSLENRDDRILFGNKEINSLINTMNATSNGLGADCLPNISLSKTFKVISSEQNSPDPVTAYSAPPNTNYIKNTSKFSSIFDTFLCCKRKI
ncbi:uncharacterized protein LOC106873881 [Octopus bimaculoides]|uniref:Uncharacterized protein n=1 Tax=Octopus bimaculoides TaxID=37653 RepID=A0A0L8GYX9_OCTBM|nr:uncharacterized protein LOC106873881 [Octopus bimaculoides]XP_052831094.1 uncharacterized protein LOC106873881 [Octopus bimaculoides]XP_052831095.1 uncharacterized protein LOC106873881 [Octopus bimaculoides]|eukprot:XP_014776892.1 PREDICTED: uncharacterized protein LOC106873881 [Octopus bimaculoides]